MNRRGFLGGILAACAAPAIVKAELIMPVRKIVVPNQTISGLIMLQRAERELLRHVQPDTRFRAFADPAYTCFVPADLYAAIRAQKSAVLAPLLQGEIGVIYNGTRFIESSRIYRR